MIYSFMIFDLKLFLICSTEKRRFLDIHKTSMYIKYFLSCIDERSTVTVTVVSIIVYINAFDGKI